MVLSIGLLAPLVAYAELSDQSMLGPGLRSRPTYDGSASQHVEMVPVIRYFGHPWFLRSTQGLLEGGARVELAPGLHAGAQLAYEPGRETGESEFLRNHDVLGVGHGASVGVHLEWDHAFGPMPITLLARARQHTDSNRGAQVDLRLSAGIYRNARVATGLFAQTTWASAKSAGSFYDTTPQSATGLPAFRAGSGVLNGSLGLLWSVDLSRDWIALGSMESRRLQGDASHSPLVEQRSNTYVSAGFAYHF